MSGHRSGSSMTLLPLLLVSYALALPDTDLRSLLLNDVNQDLMDRLGTGYEIVYPHQIRKDDWGRKGLSTRLHTDANGTTTHVQETTLSIETLDYKLQLDLELNTKLFSPTLVQLLYLNDESSVTAQKLPENCYYHAKVRNHQGSKAAFQTCRGIRGIIYLKEKTFFILPVHGNHSGKAPHFLYHVFPKDELQCGNVQESVPADDDDEDDEFHLEEEEAWKRSKYVELALVLDQSLLRHLRLPPSEAMDAAIEIINYVDLLYRPLGGTSVSLVYLELWQEDPIPISTHNMSATLDSFRDYAMRRIGRISVDATHLLTSVSFEPKCNGGAFLDSICTSSAVGLTRVDHRFQPHVSAFILAHMLAHNLGMNHDNSGCECSGEGGCVMENGRPILGSTAFSSCSVRDYRRTLARGYGACLYNMPTMRMSICGNGIQEDGEQCDCGTAQECSLSNPCCDPMTCRLIKHAQCSSGPCCKKCKLLSPDHLCRASRGECDIPEFCDGTGGECPVDLFKKNGAVCSGGLGYCYQGSCPVLKRQCQDVWGEGADSADSVCFERLNVQGTPSGNCGTDERGQIVKCAEQNSQCGVLQCSHGGDVFPANGSSLVRYVVHKINHRGTVHVCKAPTFTSPDLTGGLVKDGTKCGYQKLCINRTCTSLKSLVSGKCPTAEDMQEPCSGNGICTNANTCFCDEGWKGDDCATVDELQAALEEYYDSTGGASEQPRLHYGDGGMKVNPNLAITVIAASVVIGVGLILIVVLLLFYRHA